MNHPRATGSLSRSSSNSDKNLSPSSILSSRLAHLLLELISEHSCLYQAGLICTTQVEFLEILLGFPPCIIPIEVFKNKVIVIEEDEIEEEVDRIPLDSPKSWVSVGRPSPHPSPPKAGERGG